MAVTINTSGNGVSGTKTLGLSGIIASLVTTFTNTGTGNGHWAQILMGIAGVVMYGVDHAKTVLAAYRKGA